MWTGGPATDSSTYGAKVLESPRGCRPHPVLGPPCPSDGPPSTARVRTRAPDSATTAPSRACGCPRGLAFGGQGALWALWTVPSLFSQHVRTGNQTLHFRGDKVLGLESSQAGDKSVGAAAEPLPSRNSRPHRLRGGAGRRPPPPPTGDTVGPGAAAALLRGGGGSGRSARAAPRTHEAEKRGTPQARLPTPAAPRRRGREPGCGPWARTCACACPCVRARACQGAQGSVRTRPCVAVRASSVGQPPLPSLGAAAPQREA